LPRAIVGASVSMWLQE